MDKEIQERLDRIERLTLIAAKNVFSIRDLALYLGRSEGTIRNSIDKYPHYKDASGRIFFKREEIERHLCRFKCAYIGN